MLLVPMRRPARSVTQSRRQTTLMPPTPERRLAGRLAR
jgi:hypothetical protein